jgi:hypothetical protein
VSGGVYCARSSRRGFDLRLPRGGGAANEVLIEEPGMIMRRITILLTVVAALGAAVAVSVTLAGQAGPAAASRDTEWRFFGSDTARRGIRLQTRSTPATSAT